MALPRLRALLTTLCLLLVSSLLVYYFYYDSLSPPPKYHQPLHSMPLAGDNTSDPAYYYQPPPPPSSQVGWNNLSYKYAGVHSERAHTLGEHSPTWAPVARITPPVTPDDEASRDPNPEVEKRRQLVKSMMKEAWDNYVRYAWGYNELKPVTREPKKDSIFGPSKMGLSIVDAMPTLYLMGLKKEFAMGREWIEKNVNYGSIPHEVSVFETIIRFVGGLLSCYALTGDQMFLTKAKGVADALLPAYQTYTGKVINEK